MMDERSLLLASSRASRARRFFTAALALCVVAVVALGIVVVHVCLAPTSAEELTVSSASPSQAFPVDAHSRQRSLVRRCEERYIRQHVDHFDASSADTYEQRYFVCGREHFDRENGSIFFYTGNEADVTLYVNNTGLMWENAEAFGAVLVFAEHRYFGKSVPFGEKVLEHMQFLSSAQALADFAQLLTQLKSEWQVDVPVIAFGGSYGGMLALWSRLKYPHLVDGVIAASAPVLHFMGDPDHLAVDTDAFRRTVVFDMSAEAGASAHCIPNTRKAMNVLHRLGESAEGRKLLGKTLRMCNPEIIRSPRDVEALTYSAIGAFGSLAMANYPYPTSYLTEGVVDLPAYPVRAACDHLGADFEDNDEALLGALRDAVGVFYNATGESQCYFPVSAPSDSNQTIIALDNFMGYLQCAELYMPMSSDGADGVFPRDPVDTARDDANCMATWGVHLRPTWAYETYGGLKAIRASSNIVFSNGNYDPLGGTGVLESQSDSIVAVLIDGGAHHVDLFFRHPLDPPALTRARAIEQQHMRKWIHAFYEQKARRT